MGKMTLAVITARGGSKRIPGKNIKNFCGKPILAYSIEAALNSQLFDEVMVSTDSEEIAEIAKKYGAKVPFMRSKETSDDFATTNDVLQEVFSKYVEMGYDLKYGCCLYPTAPFITVDKLREGYELLLSDDEVSCVTPVVPFSFPPQRGQVIDENHHLHMMCEEYRLTRSQDLEKVYHDCGQFYWYDIDCFLGRKKGANYCAPLVIDELHVQDIDNETDWEVAEMKYEILQRKGLM